MNKFILIAIILLAWEGVYGQYAYFATRGKISFEKITYTRARMREMQKQFDDMSRAGSRGGGMRGGGAMMITGGMMGFNIDNIPESNTENYLLEFDETSTLLYLDDEKQSSESNSPTAGRARQATQTRTGRSGARSVGGSRGHQQSSARVARRVTGQTANTSKVLYQNFKNNTTELQVEIDDKYIISDTISDIVWKFTDEYRNIAGYECRRVNGATKDSLYLVAFYTEEIPLSAGPAFTNGLPGMILGLAIPELHIQYWATKVEFRTDLVSKNWKDKKAKTITFTDFIDSFGRYFQRGGDKSKGKRQVEEAILY